MSTSLNIFLSLKMSLVYKKVSLHLVVASPTLLATTRPDDLSHPTNVMFLSVGFWITLSKIPNHQTIFNVSTSTSTM
jgi:hypothetical protein